MLFQRNILLLSILSLSTLPSLGQLLGGVEVGDTRNEVEKKLKASPLVDAKRESTLFETSGLNGSYKTTNTLDDLQYTVHYNWIEGKTLQSLSLHSAHMPATQYPTKLKTSWKYLVNYLSSRHGKASSASTYPQKDHLAMDSILFTHKWKTDTGNLYMGPGLAKNGYKLVMTFTKHAFTSTDPNKGDNQNNNQDITQNTNTETSTDEFIQDSRPEATYNEGGKKSNDGWKKNKDSGWSKNRDSGWAKNNDPRLNNDDK